MVSHELKIEALHDITKFADLIGFKGGWQNFGTVHKKLAGFVTAPQCAKPKSRYTKRRQLLMPRGHLKSTVCSVLYVLWRIYRNPNIRILVGTNIVKLAKGFMRQLRQYLEEPTLQELVWNDRPHIRGRLIPLMDKAGRKRRSQEIGDDSETADKKLIWTTEAIQVLRDEVLSEPTVLCTSVGTNVVGQHYDLLILDDVVDFDNSNTPNKLDAVFEWCQDLESVVDPVRNVFCGTVKNCEGLSMYDLREEVGDEQVVLGTRYQLNDYYNYIIENKKELGFICFSRNIYVNGRNDERGFIWNKFDADYFAKLRKRLTARKWSSQYLNTVFADDEQLLDPDKLKFINTKLFDSKENGILKLKLTGSEATTVVRLFMFVDSAASTKATADNTCVLVGGIDPDNNIVVVDVKLGKFTSSETVDTVYKLADKWKLHHVTVETNGVGAALPGNLREQFSKRRALYIRELVSRGKKEDRIEGAIQPRLEAGQIYLADYLAPNETIRNEFIFFRQSGTHDDFIDTLAMLILNCTKTPKLGVAEGGAVKRHGYVNNRYGGKR